MEIRDDELEEFEAEGAAPLPEPHDQGCVEHDGAQIRYATYGAGSPVILLHGGLGHGGNWGYQVPALVGGYQVVLMDSRGHGRSTRDERRFSYELLASDVLAGWSDGACTALVLSGKASSRIAGVFFFACNMDPSGVKPFATTPALNRCFSRHKKDYARLSATPDRFKELVEAITVMQQKQ